MDFMPLPIFFGPHITPRPTALLAFTTLLSLDEVFAAKVGDDAANEAADNSATKNNLFMSISLTYLAYFFTSSRLCADFVLIRMQSLQYDRLAPQVTQSVERVNQPMSFTIKRLRFGTKFGKEDCTKYTIYVVTVVQALS